MPTSLSVPSTIPSNPAVARSRRRRRRVLLTGVAVALLVSAAVLVRPVVAQVVQAASGKIITGVGGSTAGRPTAEDGYIEESVSPFASVPAISRLQPDLRLALRAAARAARADGVHVVVTSGWRDQRYQQWIYDRTVASEGEEKASQQVAAGSTSRHLTGDAVDIGDTEADRWMQQHGAAYGLCQIYSNEIWHYELATEPGGTCPPQYPDASARH